MWKRCYFNSIYKTQMKKRHFNVKLQKFKNSDFSVFRLNCLFFLYGLLGWPGLEKKGKKNTEPAGLQRAPRHWRTCCFFKYQKSGILSQEKDLFSDKFNSKNKARRSLKLLRGLNYSNHSQLKQYLKLSKLAI